MSNAIDGHTSVSIIAGPLHPSTNNPERHLFMGNSLHINIDPETARQWIAALEKIASEAPKSPDSSGFSIE